MKVDIHNHILPDLDDGAKNWTTSIEMAKQAVDHGLKNIIATPHHLKNNYYNEGDRIKKQCQILNRKLSEAKIPLFIFSGQEVRIHGELLTHLKNGQVLPLAESRYVLIELPTHTVPQYTERLFFQLLCADYVPIIAHPERNEIFQKEPLSLMKLLEIGSLAQLDIGSLRGDFGKKAKKSSKLFLREGIIDFVATDAHDVRKRSIEVMSHLPFVQRLCTANLYQKILQNSNRILSNEWITR
ncbi:tyrosine-protein phosphatase [Listeria ilorinensis]|uniref:tyrosine-protein phosphatase n=1 Tax=Listeria ilorinensis TaxID=2867439 RepID=UPI001EF70714|nr:CpsB/CapC family capsule biosynthesis tyrosine phosphatase [Listeria ilorinensis]